MKRRRANNDRLTYVYLGIVNCCVLAMFLVVLSPTPRTEQPVIASAIVPHVSVQGETQVSRPITGTPSRVVVPSVGIDMVVRPGQYDVDAKTWTIDHHSAFHADVTVPVNNANGTTLIYGHAGWGIFGTLPEAGAGAEAYVYTIEGHRFTYTLESNRQVDPSDVSALTSTGPPRLVLQTCSGAFDAYRTLVTFRFKEVTRDE